jgi:hypothetical protein
VSFVGDLAKKIGDKVSEAMATNIAKVVGGGILIMLGAGWLWVWHHFNPQFDYRAEPSALSSHFVSLGQILNQIEKDSHVYCSGGWDQRLGWLGMRRCYRFTFVPLAIYKTTVCTHDQRTAQIRTTDQLIALQYFQHRFGQLECFRTLQQNDPVSYNITAGKDSQLRRLQFPNEPAQEVPFCGCTEDEEQEIARAIGALLLRHGQ